jgi:hypothetical protein
VKTVTLPDFLTEEQIAEAVQLYEAEAEGIDATEQILTRVIEPNMAAINKKLGQENDARYLAYAVVYALSQAARRETS